MIAKIALWTCWVFFVVNLFFVTYTISMEPLVIPDLHEFKLHPHYPLWPPKPLIDNLHNFWIPNFDNILLHRPAFYKCFMWWEQLFFGPYYAFAIFAFWTRKNWIRIPSIIYGSVMFTKITVLMAEGAFGSVHRSPKPLTFIAVHTPYLIIPLFLVIYFWAVPAPFKGTPPKTPTQPKPKPKTK